MSNIDINDIIIEINQHISLCELQDLDVTKYKSNYNRVLSQSILESIEKFNTLLYYNDIDTSDVDTLDCESNQYSKDDIELYYKPVTYRVVDKYITI